jgi:hypothetical protein
VIDVVDLYAAEDVVTHQHNAMPDLGIHAELLASLNHSGPLLCMSMA